MGREEVTGNYVYKHSTHVFASITSECEEIFCFSSPVGLSSHIVSVIMYRKRHETDGPVFQLIWM